MLRYRRGGRARLPAPAGIVVIMTDRTSRDEGATDRVGRGDPRTETQSIESDTAPDAIVAVLADARRIPEWAPAFVDTVSGDAQRGWEATKDGRSFNLRVALNPDRRRHDRLSPRGRARSRRWRLPPRHPSPRRRQRHRHDSAPAGCRRSSGHRHHAPSGARRTPRTLGRTCTWAYQLRISFWDHPPSADGVDPGGDGVVALGADRSGKRAAGVVVGLEAV